LASADEEKWGNSLGRQRIGGNFQYTNTWHPGRRGPAQQTLAQIED